MTVSKTAIVRSTTKKAFAVLAALFISAILIPLPASADDEALHFGFSAVFGVAAESVLHYKTQLGPFERIALGTIIGSVPGLAKELIDSGEDDNSFSGSDMAADVAGAFVGALAANFINEGIKVKVEDKGKKATVAYQFRF